MRGPLRRIRPARREAEAATIVAPEPPPAGAPAIGAGGIPAPVGEGPWSPLPAGVAPEELIGAPLETRRRGKLRRRLHHLRRVRELMLRDVGGLVYEFHRAGAGSGPGEPGAALVDRKLERLRALDAERRGLEASLGDRRAETVLREPGVGGTCSSCGEYLASDARFCSRCGETVGGEDGRRAAVQGDARAMEPLATAPADGATEVAAGARVDRSRA